MLNHINISKLAESSLRLLPCKHRATTHTNANAPLCERENNPHIAASAAEKNPPEHHHLSPSAALSHQEESINLCE
jgi:hypothetical protein